VPELLSTSTQRFFIRDTWASGILTRAGKGERKTNVATRRRNKGEARPQLDGFDAFEDVGLLR